MQKTEYFSTETKFLLGETQVLFKSLRLVMEKDIFDEQNSIFFYQNWIIIEDQIISNLKNWLFIEGKYICLYQFWSKIVVKKSMIQSWKKWKRKRWKMLKFLLKISTFLCKSGQRESENCRSKLETHHLWIENDTFPAHNYRVLFSNDFISQCYLKIIVLTIEFNKHFGGKLAFFNQMWFEEEKVIESKKFVLSQN